MKKLFLILLVPFMFFSCKHTIDQSAIPWEKQPEGSSLVQVLTYSDYTPGKKPCNYILFGKNDRNEDVYSLNLIIQNANLYLDGKFIINKHDITLQMPTEGEYIIIDEKTGAEDIYTVVKGGNLTATFSKDYKSITIKGSVTFNRDGKDFTVNVNQSLNHIPTAKFGI